MGACKGLPDVSFGGGGRADGGGAEDATLPTEDGAVAPDDGAAPSSDASRDAGGGSDAGEDAGDDAGPTDVEDAAVPEAGIACGDASVQNCAQCAGATLRCKKAAIDQCVSDCSSCGAAWLPCWHCTNNGSPRGVCQAVGNNGTLSCATGNACACDASTDCPSSGGGSQVCILSATANSGGTCATCGQASTNGVSCELDDGGAGTCSAGTSTPACQ
jgi:hypothetical protein